jgi:hypothetical protein
VIRACSILVLGLAAGVIACGAATGPANGSTATTPAINVSGVLDRGPVPSCPTGEPCDPVATGTFLDFSRAGYPDVRAYVGPGGAFALHLDPGAYTIAAAPPPFRGKLTPDMVRVPQQGTLNLRLAILPIT